MNAWASLAITLLSAAVGIAATWGALQVRIKVLESSVKAAEKGRERQGARIGVVEERLAFLEGQRQSPPAERTRRMSRIVEPPPEESGGVEG